MTERPDMAHKIPLAASFSHSQRIVPNESSPANRPQRLVPPRSPRECLTVFLIGSGQSSSGRHSGRVRVTRTDRMKG
jgi:hypothetical protein